MSVQDLKSQIESGFANLSNWDKAQEDTYMDRFFEQLADLEKSIEGLEHPPTWWDTYEDSLGFHDEDDPAASIDFSPAPSGYEGFLLAAFPVVSNSAKTWSFKPRYYFRPLSMKGVLDCLKFALSQGVAKFRPIGSRHSYSETTTTDGCVIDLRLAHPYRRDKHNATVDLLDQSALDYLWNPVLKPLHIDVPGGLTIAMLNHILTPDNTTDKVRFGRKRLFNMGGGDIQAFAGALANGTHGTMGKYSAYHDMIRSVLLVTVQDGQPKIFRIEPTNGITNPDVYLNGAITIGDYAVELLQDDQLFSSVAVSQGCMGIVLSAIVEVTDMEQYYEELVYGKDAEGWTKKFQDKLKGDIGVWQQTGSQTQCSILLNPYAKDRVHSLVVKKMTPASHVQGGVPAITKKVLGRPICPKFMKNNAFIVNIMIGMLNREKLQKNRRLIEMALSSLNDNRDNRGGYLDLSYKIWNAGSGKLKEFGTGIEYAFPADKIVEVINKLLEEVQKNAQKKDKLLLNGPIAIRFVWGSPVYLAANYTENVAWGNPDGPRQLWAYVEVARITSKNEDDDIREKKIFKNLQNVLESLGGRPHWGLNFGADTSNYSKMRTAFPKLELWLKALERLSPDGVFDNKWVKVWREEWRNANGPNLPIEPLIE